ncbi:DUF983 domain-containing protein [bacterium]|nr:DUF983 domain-containing protein [bacterium]
MEAIGLSRIVRSALLLRCCNCMKGHVYSGVLNVAKTCDVCGFPLAKHEAGDGPAFFVMTFLCLLVSALAGWVELAFAPPLWVHALLWPFVTLGLGLYLLRVVKAAMIGLEIKTLPENFKNKP